MSEDHQISDTKAERTMGELKEFDSALDALKDFKVRDIWVFIRPLMPNHLQVPFSNGTCRTLLRTAFAEGYIEIDAIQ